MSSNSEHQPDGGQNSGIPAPLYRWPRRGTKRFATLVMLLSGSTASHLDVLAGANTYRGAAVVLALKEAGFPIESYRQTVHDATGRKTRIARYYVPSDKLGDVLADATAKGVKWWA